MIRQEATNTTLQVLRSQGITNVMIFVCDALRWDSVPSEAMDLGVAYKTVAASLYTGSSFPSIVSGLYPPKHSVNTWQDVLAFDRRGLFSIPGYNVSLRCETSWVDSTPGDSAVHRVLGRPPEISLDEI